GATIALGYGLTFSRLGRWLIITLIVQGAVAVVAAPLLVALFQSGLAAAGIGSLTTATIGDLATSPGAIALLVLFLLLAVVALVVQAAVVAIAADGQQADAGGELPRPRAIALGVARRLRSLARPSTLLLLPYLLLLAPLGHAALGSVLTRWIAIPNFISGELMRSPAGTVLWVLISIVVWYVNLRLILTVPFLVVGGMTAPQAFRASWAATRWRLWRMVGIILSIVVAAGVALLVLGGLALAVTAVADAIAPDASPIVAGIAFATAQVVGFFVVGTAVVVQTHAFVRIVRLAVSEWDGSDPEESWNEHGEREPSASQARIETSKGGLRWAGAAAIAVTVAGVAVLSFAVVPTLDRYSDGSTLVIAHRGVTDHAVENTIPALEAAVAAGADVVEFDVQQTRDGDWVVMHDFDLMRLAGISGAVKDMTLAEATAITVREGDNEGMVPSMREWVHRAKGLGMPLLIEIKPHGQETPDYLEGFYAILDEAGITDVSLYHSLSAGVVADQTALRPETTVGYIVPVAFGAGVPDTPADFIVVEEFSYTDALREALHDSGRGILVWTVDDETAMRGYLRDGVDGIVTDQTALLLQQRDEVADERGLAPKLLDALGRALTLW
ncbi:MAG TPA: glycerophosphoryl diester phosphodiesterase membrane domain-containing protein, partial [Microbacteriaceae bacterium]|nr:glycerophosphoryl diester phosphodiesterase membrane domain-containing protein [Microbacteriaceae bacterium]